MMTREQMDSLQRKFKKETEYRTGVKFLLEHQNRKDYQNGIRKCI